MRSFRRVFTSSVGTKLLIGLTGLALFAYLILHLAGNLLIFFGQETFNEYSHKLISNPLVVPVEIGLLLIFLSLVWPFLDQPPSPDQTTSRGAFLEQSGRKQWQPVANAPSAQTAELLAIFCHRLHPLAVDAAW